MVEFMHERKMYSVRNDIALNKIKTLLSFECVDFLTAEFLLANVIRGGVLSSVAERADGDIFCIV